MHITTAIRQKGMHTVCICICIPRNSYTYQTGHHTMKCVCIPGYQYRHNCTRIPGLDRVQVPGYRYRNAYNCWRSKRCGFARQRGTVVYGLGTPLPPVATRYTYLQDTHFHVSCYAYRYKIHLCYNKKTC
jgi:hypothetical protein